MAFVLYRVSNNEIACDEYETARYLGYSRTSPPDGQTAALIRGTCRELRSVIAPQAVYDIFPLRHDGLTRFSFAGESMTSDDLSRNLNHCTDVALFAATLGPKADALIRRTQASDSAGAAVLQAAGAMFIESFVDSINGVITAQFAAQGKKTHPRYSPGYGDVPLETQRIFFSLLPCAKIGLTLMDSLVMAPEKSVTAFIGAENL